MYGTQALPECLARHSWFENDVNMYGTQAVYLDIMYFFKFENDVNMYGTQAQRGLTDG